MSQRSPGDQLAVALIAAGSIMAAGLWYLQPRQWLAAAAALAFFGVVTTVLARARVRSTPAARASIGIADSVAIGALIVCLPLALVLVGIGGFLDSAELSQRVTMATLGVYLVFSGNAIPKTLQPLGRDAARIQALQRFCGWTWALAGLAYVFAWLVLPLALALPLSMASVGGGLLLVAGRTWRQRVREGRT